MSSLVPKSVTKQMCERGSIRQQSRIYFVPPEFNSASGEFGSKNQIKIKTGPGVKKVISNIFR